MNRSQYNRFIRELRADNSKIRKQIYDMKRFNRKTDYYRYSKHFEMFKENKTN